VVEPVELPPAELGTCLDASHDLEHCLQRLGLLKRAKPLKKGRGFALAVTIQEFDALASAPEIGRITSA
jgi:hypothetical protein